MSCTAGAAGRHAMNKHRILFLAANPSKGTGVVLDKECAAIEHELRLMILGAHSCKAWSGGRSTSPSSTGR